jgi:hypothetical protein
MAFTQVRGEGGASLEDTLKSLLQRDQDSDSNKEVHVHISAPKKRLTEFNRFWNVTVSKSLSPATEKHAWGEYTAGTMWQVSPWMIGVLSRDGVNGVINRAPRGVILMPPPTLPPLFTAYPTTPGRCGSS